MKLTKFLALCLMCLLCLTSCKNDEPQNDTKLKTTQFSSTLTGNPNYDQLIMEIDSIGLSYQSAIGTRSIFSNFRRLLKIVAADAAGAFIGAIGGPAGMIAGAAVCSAATVALTSPRYLGTPATGQNNSDIILNSPEIGLGPNVLINPDNGPATFNDSIGYYHNLMLYRLENNNVLYQPDLNLMAKVSYAQAGTMFNVSLDAMEQELNSNTNLQTYINNELYKFNEDENAAQYLVRISAYYHSFSSELTILASILNAMQNSDVQAEDLLMSNIINAINNNRNLTLIQRQRLTNACLIGHASYSLWGSAMNE